MFNLKPLSKDAIESALAKAERYRLLNEPDEAESICLDVLEVDPDNQAATVMLLLALSDQCGEASGAAVRAQQLARGLQNEYERWYYSGLVAERRARAHLKRGGAATDGIYDWLMDALDCFERAERVRPAGNDDAILRWNTCVRVLQRHPRAEAVERDKGRTVVSRIASGLGTRGSGLGCCFDFGAWTMPRILIVTGDGGESYETWFAVHRFQEAGYETRVAAPSKKRLHLVMHDFEPGWDTYKESPGYAMESDLTFQDVVVNDYDAIVLIGGRAPEYLRNDARLIGIIQEFDRQGKWLFSICHGVQLLAAAGLLKGKKVTCYEHVRNEVETVGATWVECEAMREGRIVSAPTWQEHPAFYREIFACLRAPVPA